MTTVTALARTPRFALSILAVGVLAAVLTGCGSSSQAGASAPATA